MPRNMNDFAENIGIPLDLVEAAKTRVDAGDAMLLIVSGKMGSGKDTLAPMICAALGHPDAENHYYSAALKDEADEIIHFLRDRFGVKRFEEVAPVVRVVARNAVAQRFDVTLAEADRIVEIVLEECRANPALHARDHSDVARTLLQYFGTDVRRTADPEHWVRLALRETFEALAQGQSVYYTDGRFPNELDPPRLFGAPLVRLDISRECQLERLRGRDGVLTVSEDKLDHESETAVDDYEHFTVRVRNEGTVEEGLSAVLAGLRSAQLVAA